MKNRLVFVFILILLATGNNIFSQEALVRTDTEHYIWPKEQNVLQKLDEWQDLKFGVIFHWGLYSVPGIVESWSICSEDEDWISRDTSMTYEEYKKWYWGLIDEFNPVNFNPEQWASVMKSAGMKYMIITTKHHDGFCLFDTKQTDFSIMHGPFRNNPKANLIKYILEAFRKQDFMVGTYFSKPDWHCDYYWWRYFATPNRNVNYSIKKHPERWGKYKQFTYNQIEELMIGYGKVDILWLDGGQVRPPHQDVDMPKIATMARSHQPDLLIVDRTVQGIYENYHTPEREIPAEQLSFPWESCITLSEDWGWVPNDKYKSAEEVIALLTEVTAKGGNLVLGVGPTPDGIIEDDVVVILKKIGEWLDKNGKAIYNTRITPHYHENNLWFTADKDGKTLYAIYIPSKDTNQNNIEWGINIPAKGSKISLLHSGKTVKWELKDSRVKINFAQNKLSKDEIQVFSFRVK